MPSDTATIRTLLSSLQARLAEGLDAAGGDRAEEHHARAAEHRARHERRSATPATGNRPIRTRKPPPVATTYRLRTRVIATRPMFWANALHMKPLKSGLSARAERCRPAARPRWSARRRAGPRSRRAPACPRCDSVIDTSITTHIERIAASSNCGAPKWNGVGKPNDRRLATGARCRDAEGATAISVPATRPSSTAIWLQKPAGEAVAAAARATSVDRAEAQVGGEP